MYLLVRGYIASFDLLIPCSYLQYVSYERPTLSKGYLKAEGKPTHQHHTFLKCFAGSLTLQLVIQVLLGCLDFMLVLEEVARSRHLTGTKRRVSC